MANRTIGVQYQWSSSGMNQMGDVIAKFTNLNAAASTFVGVSQSLAVASGSLMGAGYGMLKPFLEMRQYLFGMGLEYERMIVQIEGMVGSGAKAAQMYKNIAKAAQDVPDAFVNVLRGMQEFTKMGIDVQKTYGSVASAFGDITITASTALSGLASRFGASLDTVAGHLKTAVTMGRADYLEYWVGPLEVQAMQMAGVFVGTWQQQFDKAVAHLGKRFSHFSKSLTFSIGGITQNLKDMGQTINNAIIGIATRSGVYEMVRKGFERMFNVLNAFFDPTKVDGWGVTFQHIFQDIVGPAVKFLTDLMEKAAIMTVKFAKWFSAPEHRKLVVFWGKAIGVAGLVMVAAGAFLLLGKMALFAMGSMLSLAPILLLLGAFAVAGLLMFNGFRSGWLDAKNTVGGIKNWIIETMEWASNFFTVMWDIIANGTKKGTAVVHREAWNKLGPKSQNFLFGFLEVWTKMINGFQAVMLKIKDLGGISGIFEKIWGGFKSFYDILKFIDKNIISFADALKYLAVIWVSYKLAAMLTGLATSLGAVGLVSSLNPIGAALIIIAASLYTIYQLATNIQRAGGLKAFLFEVPSLFYGRDPLSFYKDRAWADKQQYKYDQNNKVLPQGTPTAPVGLDYSGVAGSTAPTTQVVHNYGDMNIIKPELMSKEQMVNLWESYMKEVTYQKTFQDGKNHE